MSSAYQTANIIDDQGCLAFQTDKEAFLSASLTQSDEWLLIETNTNIDELKTRFRTFKQIAVSVSSFTDGRVFSIGRQLRELGFTGSLIACGSLLPDQHSSLIACGFNGVITDADLKYRIADDEKTQQ